MATLYDLAMQYLAQALPDGKIFPDTIPPLVPPAEEDTPVSPEEGIVNTQIARNMAGGDGSAGLRTRSDYSPYAYRQAMAKSGAGIPSGILSDSKFLYGNQIQLPGILGMGQEFIKNIMPVNPRAKLENELLGSGVMLDDIGRVVSNDYNTAEGIMAGYNAAKITDATFDKRRERIQKTISEKRAKGLDTSVLENRLDLLDEAQDLFGGARTRTKDILAEEYKKDPKYQFTGPDVQGGLTFPSTYNEDDEDETLEEILKSQITGAPISYGGFPGYGVPPASGLSVAPGAVIDRGLAVAPGAVIDQGLSVAPGGGITTIKPTTPDGDTADFAYTTTTPKTINITNPYSGGGGGVQSNFGGGASKSKSSSPTNVGNPFGYR
jgi:hypothetical protein